MSLTEYEVGSGSAIADQDEPTEAQMSHAALDLLVPSPTNPRKTFDVAKLQELADSIRAIGLMQPILVRSLPAQMLQDSAFTQLAGQELLDAWEHKPKKLPRPAYEIVAGERRWRASILAQLRTVPIVVRPLTDAQVLEAQLVENLQRDDLHPLEEAEGYQRLCEATAIRKEDIAGKIGKSRSYVYQRLQLLDLAPESREAFRAGQVDASKAQLLATVADPKQQIKALKEFTREGWNGRAQSVRECRDWLQQNILLKIKDAPFDSKDATLLEGCGACGDCPKRTHADRDLFAAFDGPDMCTDATCYQAKDAAHLDRIRTDAAAKGMDVIAGKEAKKLKPHSYGNEIKGYTRLDDKIDGESVAKLVGKDVKPVLFVDPHTQQKVKVLPTEKVNALLKDKGIAVAPKKPTIDHAAEHKLAEEKAAAETTQRQRVAAEIASKIRDGALAVMTVTVLRRLCTMLFEGCSHHASRLLPLWGLPLSTKDDKHAARREDEEAAERHVQACPDEELRLIVLTLMIADELSVSYYNLQEPSPSLDLLASETGVDVDEIRRAIAAEARETKKAAKATKAAPPPGAKDQAAPQGSKAGEVGAAAPKGRSAGRKRTSVEEATQGIADAMQNMGEPAGGFAIGQRVRFKMDLKGHGGKLRKVSGREGTIKQAIGDRAYSVRFGEKAHEVATADYTELEAVEDAQQESPAGVTRNLDPQAAWPFKLEPR